MSYRILYKKSAGKELLQLPVSKAIDIKKAINQLSEIPRPKGCKKLKGTTDAYQIRIGDYRVIYEISDHILTVMIIKIAHRQNVYR